MTNKTYFYPTGGLPTQKNIASDRSVFKTAYAVIPQTVMKDIVVSYFPFWERTRAWVLARPMSGFAETFSQSIVEILPKGGSDKPELDSGAECVIFVLDGKLELTIVDKNYILLPGSYAFIPPNKPWTIFNKSNEPARIQWIRKIYNVVEGLELPQPIVVNENDLEPIAMPDTNGVWSTTRFVDPFDLRHDMHVNIVSIKPGGVIPFMETHVMEHGIYVLQGKGVYHLNEDSVEVEAGDFLWLRAFCPQACYAGGQETFRYLLYKDVNRHMPLKIKAL
ncbi:MAG: bifunctional allantoicase/(S)-ureidoglycine aminohydrolase [Paracoccaceae bacterium]|nr:bifunctional allantoicase/(S)-ureidoglycine aminohydrolase [Paracoccaceae bacterium]